MKKLFILVLILFTLLLTSCGNMNIGLGSYSYYGVHLAHSNVDIKIISWYEAETGIEVVLENGDHLFLAEGTYILLEDSDRCPICDDLSTEE